MTDLSYKPTNQNKNDDPFGEVILALLPFAIAFLVLIEIYL